ncbi:AAA family ATPase [Haliea sp. E17]|uniref:AAA family ATPase n=1 Tax=Haliea sp. E17 TaxID=3401576 RepID=UPI003AB04897
MPEHRLFVFTAGNAAARAHLDDSIRKPIDWPKISHCFNGEAAQSLEQLHQQVGLYAWGAVPGARNIPNWELMAPGDWVLCVFDSTYHYVAQVIEKHHNPAAAETVWSTDPEGRTWEYMYFLTKPTKIEVPLSAVNQYLSQQYMGFVPISDAKIGQIEQDFGSVERFIQQSLVDPVSDALQFKAILSRYKEAGVVFQSLQRGQQYFVSEVDESRAQVERIDANAPATVTFSSYETAIGRAKEAGGRIPFAEVQGTVAIGTTWLQGDRLWCDTERRNVILLDSPAETENALKAAISALRVDRSGSDVKLYKPATLEAVIRGIEGGVLKTNEFTFETLLPIVLSIFERRSIEGEATQAAMAYFHLASDLLWMLAYHQPSQPITSTPSQSQLVERVRFATLKGAFWDILQKPDVRARVLQHIEDTWFSPMHYFLIRSNSDTSYGDKLGERYAYHNRVPNSRRLLEGGKIIVDRKVNGQVLLLGHGTMAMGEDLGKGADGNTHFANDYSAWTSSIPEKPLTDELKALVQTVPNYNVQHAIRPLDKATFDALASYIDPSYSDKPEPKSPEPVMTDEPLNQILYGPPGTGKTYITREIAVKIADPAWFEHAKTTLSGDQFTKAIFDRYQALVDEERIVFTTFHQSFGYEDFVEGIRANTDEETGGLRYDLEPGVFKHIVDRAGQSVGVHSTPGLADEPTIWKISIGPVGKTELRNYCFEHGEARVGWNKLGDLTIPYEDRTDAAKAAWDTMKDVNRHDIEQFTETVKIGDVFLCLKSKETIQAIGIVTSDYSYDNSLEGHVEPNYPQVRKVNWLATDLDLNILKFNRKKKLPVKTFCKLNRISWDSLAKALEEGGHPIGGSPASPEMKPNYVLIIDEINRGNVARVFGELITLLEPSKRIGANDEREVVLPYSKEPFAVPDNLYVVGTMNTADKSLAQIDIALRRRFVFKEMPPRMELLLGTKVHGVDLGEMLDIINQRIEVLLDRDHLIGHSYFMDIATRSTEADRAEELSRVFQHAILPLLQEYFFDDWERIAWVLNDGQKAEGDKFIQIGGSKSVADLFPGDTQEQVMDRRNRINQGAFLSAAAYQGIL